MKIRMVFLSTLIASLTLLSGCSALMKDHKPNDNPAPGKQVVAKVLIYENGTYGLVSGDSKETRAIKCSVKKNYTKGGNPRCKGFSDGNIEQVLTIPLLRTKGSICWTTYDIRGAEEQTCWPPVK